VNGTTGVRALVTGGAGFIGSRLVRRLLQSGATVRTVDDYSRGRLDLLPQQDALSAVEGDVSQDGLLAAVARDFAPTHLFHLAAMHYIPDCDANPDRAHEVNVGGTEQAARAAREAGVQALLLVSSAAVFAPSDDAHIESSAIGPLEVYGQTKVDAELAVADLAGACRVEVVRLFNVYGAADTNPHVIPVILEQVLAGNATLKLGRVDTIRDYIYVDDAAEAMARLGLSGIGGATVVGSGAGSRVDEVARTIGRHAGLDITIETDPTRLRPVDRPVLLSNPARLLATTGLRARSLEDGLKATWAAEYAARVNG